MLQFGGFLVLIGFGSSLLHFTDVQFKLVMMLEDVQPAAGIVIGLIGAALIAVGVALRKRNAAQAGAQAAPMAPFPQGQPAGFPPPGQPAGFPPPGQPAGYPPPGQPPYGQQPEPHGPPQYAQQQGYQPQPGYQPGYQPQPPQYNPPPQPQQQPGPPGGGFGPQGGFGPRR